jgi:hypothetical protein
MLTRKDIVVREVENGWNKVMWDMRF